MKTVELFSGTESFSKVAKELGHKTFTVDNDYQFRPDLICNLHFLDTHYMVNVWKEIKFSHIVWMSPPCKTLSMASGNTHWTIDRKPKTEQAKKTLVLIDVCKKVMDYCIENNIIFFIENPRARMRWFLPVEYRYTVWYCQYGDSRAKPTDIWTNLENWTPRQCKNNNPLCNHIRAPRGSKTGTQGLKGSINRGVIPRLLFIELFKVIKKGNDKNV